MEPFNNNSRSNRGTLGVLAVAMIVASLGTSIANIALPEIARAFGLANSGVQPVVTLYLAALTVSVVLAGRLGDRFGARRVLTLGLAAFVVSSAACGLAPGLGFLIVARAVQGASAAVLMTLSVALVQQVAPPGKVGQAIGLIGTMSAVGTALGPSLGGILIELFGWRAIFALLAALSALALVGAFAFLCDDVRPITSVRPNWTMLRRPSLLAGLAANAAVASVMMTTLVVGPFFLGDGLGLRQSHVGLVMSVGPVLSILTGIPSGRLADRFGPDPVRLAGLAALILGCLGLAVLPHWFGLTGYLAAISLLTPGYQLFQSAHTTAVMAGTDATQRGGTSGLLALSRNLGLMFGASVMSGLFFLGARSAGTEADMAQGLTLTFLVSAALMAATLALAARKSLAIQADAV